MGQQSQQSQGSKGGMGQSPYGYQTTPYQMNPAQQGSFFSNGGSNRPGMVPPRPMDGFGSQFGMGGMFGGGSGYLNPQQVGGQNPLARGGFNGADVRPGPGIDPTIGGSVQTSPPGVQTFQNGAYANWGQPQPGPAGVPDSIPPNPGVQTFNNGAYANWGQPPATPQPSSNPFMKPGPSGYFTNGY